MSSGNVEALFLHHARPRILARVNYLTRRFMDAQRREDLRQEALCAGWYVWQRTFPGTNEPEKLSCALAKWCAWRALGSKVGTCQTGCNDVLSPSRIWHEGVGVVSLHQGRGQGDDGMDLCRMLAGRESESWECAVVDLDWPMFVRRLHSRNRLIVRLRQEGCTVQQVAEYVGITKRNVWKRLASLKAHWFQFTETFARDDAR